MSFQEILLLSIVVITAYLGPMVIRRSAPGNRMYGWMLVANLAIALIALAALRTGESFAGLLGVVAIGAGGCLIVVPPILRALTRRALLADQLRFAMILIDLRDLLQPGMGAMQERELVSAIVAVRSGQVDAAVDALLQTKAQLRDALSRRRIDERVVTTFLYARAWKRAIEHYEETLDQHSGMTSPHLVVEMIRAYCEVRELGRAADLVQEIEASPAAQEPLLAALVNRARMVFLAYVGREEAVEAITASTGPLGMMPSAARHFWFGVARLNAGDRPGARLSLNEAVKLAGRDKRARELALFTLDSLEEPGVLGPHVVPASVAELADRLTSVAKAVAVAGPKMRAPRLSGVPWATVPVTTSLIAANVLIALLIGWRYHGLGDLGAMVRWGANVNSAVSVGEWWRLSASMFLHIGMVHLLFNMLGVWFLGRLLEQVYGGARYFTVYMFAGLVGALASFALGPPGMSAGASGAVLGILGALIVELALFRQHYPDRWRKAVLGNLVFMAVASIIIGFFFGEIDQYAHVCGLLSGGLAAALISPRSFASKAVVPRTIAGALFVVGVCAVLYGAYGAWNADFGKTLAKHPLMKQKINGLQLLAPKVWTAYENSAGNVELVDTSPHTVFEIRRQPAGEDIHDRLAKWLAKVETEGATRRGLGKVQRIHRRTMPVPEPWASRELTVVADDVGGELLYRVVVFGRIYERELWIGTLYTFDAVAKDIAPTFRKVLLSVDKL